VYDALFDQKLISFENTGKIILSSILVKTNYKDLGITGTEVINKFSASNIRYLERHREQIN
jgi:putative restriction endonuclease